MARQPDPGPASFLDEVRKLRARAARLENASPLTGSGMSVTAAGVVNVSGRLDVAGGLSYSSAWASAVAYRAGQLVVEPGGTLVTAKADHTSGNTFNPADWTSAAVAASRRGGRYSSPANALTAATQTYVTLGAVSGDTDLVSSGNFFVPAGAGGVWAVTAVWLVGAGQGQSSNRMFVEINVNSSASAPRASVGYLEDRSSVHTTLALAAGDTVQFSVYASSGTTYTTAVTVDAYRIGG